MRVRCWLTVFVDSVFEGFFPSLSLRFAIICRLTVSFHFRFPPPLSLTVSLPSQSYFFPDLRAIHHRLFVRDSSHQFLLFSTPPRSLLFFSSSFFLCFPKQDSLGVVRSVPSVLLHSTQLALPDTTYTFPSNHVYVHVHLFYLQYCQSMQ